MGFTNTGLVLRIGVALLLLVAGLILMRRRGSRAGAALVVAGGALFLAGGLYGLAVLRPFVGREFDTQWYVQLDLVDMLSTFGLLACAAGLFWHARQLPPK